MSNSSTKSRREILVLGVISAKKAERLLTYWVNLQPQSEPMETITRGDFRRLLQRYPEIFPGDLNDAVTYKWNVTTARVVNRYLRKAWDAPDLRHCEWYLTRAEHSFRVHSVSTERMLRSATEAGKSASEWTTSYLANKTIDEIDEQLDEMDEPPPTPNLVEAAIFHFRRNIDRALHCPNPDCHTPYFFASKKGQKYCSEPCALPSQRAAKRRWWDEHRAKGAK